jgi:hypothetical protein
MHTPLQQLKEKVSVQEFQFSSLVEHGRGLLDSMDPGTEAEQYMDGKLSTLEQRWTELVSQVLMVPLWYHGVDLPDTLYPLASLSPVPSSSQSMAEEGIVRNTGAYLHVPECSLFHLL